MNVADGTWATRPDAGGPLSVLQRAAAGWRATEWVSRLWIVGLALGLAFVASTQFLAQPFIWRHWSLDEIVLAWVGILGERVLVALAIAVAVMLVLSGLDRAPNLARPLRVVLYALAVTVAAVAGEALLRALDAPNAAPGPTAFAEHVLRWSSIALAVTGLRVAWLRALNADAAAARSRQAVLDANAQFAVLRLQTLQAQIEPHFLFNTLATVKRLGGTEPDRCARLLSHLVDFIALSQATQPNRQRWRVADEIELVRAYLGVIELRMDGRLRVRFSVEPAVELHDAPPLALATLVENAVKHGITPSTEGGEIHVAASLSGECVRLSVADTGVGLRSAGGSGIGLANTRARLRSLFGEQAQLRLAANQPSGVIATLEWPRDRERKT